jgi:hypothetical protein
MYIFYHKFQPKFIAKIFEQNFRPKLLKCISKEEEDDPVDPTFNVFVPAPQLPVPETQDPIQVLGPML